MGGINFLPSQKSSLLNSNSFWDLKVTGLLKARLLGVNFVIDTVIYMSIYFTQRQGLNFVIHANVHVHQTKESKLLAL